METDITANRFCQIVGLRSQGTASKYVAKGLIILGEPNQYGDRFVDIDKTIEALLKGREHHQELAQKAIDFFHGLINVNNVSEIETAFEPITIENNSNRQSYIVPRNDKNHLEEHTPSLMESMRDKNLIDIKLRQVQLNEKIGKLINRETVIMVFENIMIQLKKDLLNLAREKIDAILREKDNPQSAEKILYDGIHEILHRNSQL